jgi:hypothetical protein
MSRILRLTRIVPLLAVALGTACGDEAEDDPSAEREGPEGCYIVANMRCDCELDEASCTPDIGQWTPGCSSCIE